MNAREAADLVQGKLVGDSSLSVDGVCSLENPKPGHLSMITSKKQIGPALKSPISLFLAPPGFSLPNKTVIYVPEPRLALATLLSFFHPPESPKPYLHPTAVISPLATISPGCSIGPYCVVEHHAFIAPRCHLKSHVFVGAHSVIGENTIIYSHVTIYSHTKIGRNVSIHANTVVGSDGFGYHQLPDQSHKKIPQVGYTIIEDDVEIGANVTIDRGTIDETRIGRGTKIDNHVHIGHNVKIGKRCIILAYAGISGSVTIGDDCILAGKTGVKDHVHITDRVILASRAGVTKDITEPGIYSGFPAQKHSLNMKMEAALRRIARERSK